MKKIVILSLFLFCGTMMHAQKKKPISKSTPSVVIAKEGGASAEMIKNNFYLFVTNEAKKDTLLLKTYEGKGNPTECKITSFKTKGTPMYLVAWVEKNTTETKLKKEDATVTESQIWNPATKTLMIGNTQSSTKIKEIVFLDKLKNASETQERMRNSGYTFTFLSDGDFSLKDKSSETRYTYNITSLKYEPAKAGEAAPKKATKKKRK